MDPRPHTLLSDLHEELRRRLGLDRANDWARHARLVSLDETAARFVFPDTSACARLERICAPVVERALRRLTNRNLRVLCAVEPALAAGPAAAPWPVPAASSRDDADPSFDTLLVGPGNELAVRAARRFADGGAGELDTLLFTGPTGCGRTHLLRAIYCALLAARRPPAVVLLPAPRLHQQFVYALRNGLIEPFRRKLRTAEVLLVDDVQRLAAKPRTQEELAHTFDALRHHGRRIVWTSDRPSHALEGFSRPLHGRIRAALEVRLSAPDPAMRLAFLRARAAARGFACPPEALAVLAEGVTTDFHDLRRSLDALASRGGDPREGARRVVEEFGAAWGRQVTPADILQRVSEALGLRIADLCGPSRSRALVLGRTICFHLGRRHTPMTLAEIGRAFGGRDHATVHLALRDLDRRVRADRSLGHLVERIERTLRREEAAAIDGETEGRVNTIPSRQEKLPVKP